MLEKQRQQLIIDILNEKKFASVKLLTQQLNSSEATIRRDIVKMADKGDIIKIRGGAESINDVKQQSINSSSFVADKEKHADIKRLIAKKAAELCEEGESIIINGGSSTYMMGEFLAKTELNILTNSFVLAQNLSVNVKNRITLPGGEIYQKQGIILSSYDKDTIEYYHGSKMFMGTPGINELGVMESDPLLIRAELKLRKQAEKLIILADSSKLGKRSNLTFCPLTDVDMLITDSNADKALLAKFESYGIKIVIADL